MYEVGADYPAVFELLLRRYRLIIMTALALTGLAGVALLVTPVRYDASTLVFVDTAHADLLHPHTSGHASPSDNAIVDSEVEILGSDAVLLEAIALLDLINDPEFGVQPSIFDRLALMLPGFEKGPSATPYQDTLARLRSATTIKRRGLTYLITISVRSHDAQRAALIANTIAEAYIAVQLRAKIENTVATGEILASQLAEARIASVAADEDLRHAVATHTPEQNGAAGATDGALRELERAADLARSQYQTLQARAGEVALAAGLQRPDTRVISRAIAPHAPSFPQPLLTLTIAALIGLGLGVVVAFVRETVAGGFTSDSQLVRITRKPNLGDVPLQGTSRGGPVSALMVEAPLSPFAESIRRIRAGIDQRLEGKNAKARVIMVSSSVIDEGKTALSLSLARAYAAAGNRTLIIDCDLHHPAIHRHLDVDPPCGLLDFLAGPKPNHQLSAMIVRDGETGLYAVVGSRPTEVPTDQLIGGINFTRLINAAIESFDVVILDTPPLLPVADGLYLARHADIVLFVVKWSSTAQSLVRMAIAQLDATRKTPPDILTVLNQQARVPKAYARRYAQPARA